MEGMRKGVAAVACGLILGGVAKQATATPTTLAVIPIADTLGFREGLFLYAVTGYERRSTSRYEHGFYLTLGLADRLELSNDTMGWTASSLKLKAFENDRGAFSFGVMNALDGKGDLYAVGRLDFDRVRWHGGVLRDTKTRLMIGVDFDFGSDWSGGIDYISGPGSAVNAILNVPISHIPGVTISLIGNFPTHRREPIAHSISLNYGFRF
jgi:hypothetical protein